MQYSVLIATCSLLIEELKGGDLNATLVEESLPDQYVVVGRKK